MELSKKKKDKRKEKSKPALEQFWLPVYSTKRLTVLEIFSTPLSLTVFLSLSLSNPSIRDPLQNPSFQSLQTLLFPGSSILLLLLLVRQRQPSPSVQILDQITVGILIRSTSDCPVLNRCSDQFFPALRIDQCPLSHHEA